MRALKRIRSLPAPPVRSMPPDACGDLLVLPIYAALPPEMQARPESRAAPKAGPQ